VEVTTERKGKIVQLTSTSCLLFLILSIQTTVHFRIRLVGGTSNVCSTIMLYFFVENFIAAKVKVLSVASVPIVLSNPSAVDTMPADIEELFSVLNSMAVSCVRPISLDSRIDEARAVESTRVVFALESPGYLGIGGKVWDSTFVLLNVLRYRFHHLITGKKLLELGSGTGVTGKNSLY
jgi:hypothetical protein